MSDSLSTIVVGARFESSSQDGIVYIVENAGAENKTVESGAVYLFTRRKDNIWTDEALIKAPDPGVWDEFGFSITINADATVLAVGAPWREGTDPVVGTNGTGAVYLYEKNDGLWSLQEYITSTDNSSRQFGYDVLLSKSGVQLLIGDKNLNRIVLYTKASGAWQFESFIIPPAGMDYNPSEFGYSGVELELKPIARDVQVGDRDCGVHVVLDLVELPLGGSMAVGDARLFFAKVLKTWFQKKESGKRKRLRKVKAVWKRRKPVRKQKKKRILKRRPVKKKEVVRLKSRPMNPHMNVPVGVWKVVAEHWKPRWCVCRRLDRAFGGAEMTREYLKWMAKGCEGMRDVDIQSLEPDQPLTNGAMSLGMQLFEPGEGEELLKPMRVGDAFEVKNGVVAFAAVESDEHWVLVRWEKDTVTVWDSLGADSPVNRERFQEWLGKRIVWVQGMEQRGKKDCGLCVLRALRGWVSMRGGSDMAVVHVRSEVWCGGGGGEDGEEQETIGKDDEEEAEPTRDSFCIPQTFGKDLAERQFLTRAAQLRAVWRAVLKVVELACTQVAARNKPIPCAKNKTVSSGKEKEIIFLFDSVSYVHKGSVWTPDTVPSLAHSSWYEPNLDHPVSGLDYARKYVIKSNRNKVGKWEDLDLSLMRNVLRCCVFFPFYGFSNGKVLQCVCQECVDSKCGFGALFELLVHCRNKIGHCQDLKLNEYEGFHPTHAQKDPTIYWGEIFRNVLEFLENGLGFSFSGEVVFNKTPVPVDLSWKVTKADLADVVADCEKWLDLKPNTILGADGLCQSELEELVPWLNRFHDRILSIEGQLEILTGIVNQGFTNLLDGQQQILAYQLEHSKRNGRDPHTFSLALSSRLNPVSRDGKSLTVENREEANVVFERLVDGKRPSHVVIHGASGMGKTTLAAGIGSGEWLDQDILKVYPGGVFWVDAKILLSEDIFKQLKKQYKLDDQGAYRDYFRENRSLVVLDDVNHHYVIQKIGQEYGCDLLVTSQTCPVPFHSFVYRPSRDFVRQLVRIYVQDWTDDLTNAVEAVFQLIGYWPALIAVVASHCGSNVEEWRDFEEHLKAGSPNFEYVVQNTPQNQCLFSDDANQWKIEAVMTRTLSTLGTVNNCCASAKGGSGRKLSDRPQTVSVELLFRRLCLCERSYIKLNWTIVSRIWGLEEELCRTIVLKHFPAGILLTERFAPHYEGGGDYLEILDLAVAFCKSFRGPQEKQNIWIVDTIDFFSFQGFGLLDLMINFVNGNSVWEDIVCKVDKEWNSFNSRIENAWLHRKRPNQWNVCDMLGDYFNPFLRLWDSVTESAVFSSTVGLDSEAIGYLQFLCVYSELQGLYLFRDLLIKRLEDAGTTDRRLLNLWLLNAASANGNVNTVRKYLSNVVKGDVVGCFHVALRSANFELCFELCELENFSDYCWDFQELDGQDCPLSLAIQRLPPAWKIVNSNDSYCSDELIYTLVSKGFSVNGHFKESTHPVSCSSRLGLVEMSRFLISHGADVKVSGKFGDTPLDYACITCSSDFIENKKFNFEENCYNLMILLIDAGSDVNARSSDGEAPIHNVARRSGRCTKLLVDSGSDVNLLNEDGRSPLHAACHAACARAVRVLIDANCGINNKDNEGNTPLHLAAENGNLLVLQLLINAGADLYARNDEELTPLHVCIQSSYEPEAVCFLTSQIRNIHFLTEVASDIPYDASAASGFFQPYFTLLGSMVSYKANGDPLIDGEPLGDFSDIVEEAVRCEVLNETHLDLVDLFGESHTAMYFASDRGDRRLVKLLLQRGVHPDGDGNPNDEAIGSASRCPRPLHAAIRSYGLGLDACEQIANLLLDAGARTDVLWGCEYLYNASKNGLLSAVLKLLRSKKVNPNFFCENRNRTPLQIAALNGHDQIVTALLQAGALVNQPADLVAQDTEERWISFRRRFICNLSSDTRTHFKDIEPCIQSGDGRWISALHFSSCFGHLETVKLLLQSNANVSDVDGKGDTPLHYASRCGHTDIVRILLENDAKVDFVNEFGISALHYAAALGHTGVVSQLLNARASPSPLAVRAFFAPRIIESRKHHFSGFTFGGTPEPMMDNVDRTEQNRHVAVKIEDSVPNNKPPGHLRPVNTCTQNTYTDHLKDDNCGAASTSDDTRCSALHLSCGFGHLDIVKLLVAAGSDVNTPDTEGDFALLYAERENNKAIVIYLQSLNSNEE